MQTSQWSSDERPSAVAEALAEALREVCVWTTPFGLPVDPLVAMTSASSGLIVAPPSISMVEESEWITLAPKSLANPWRKVGERR
jgi:hypothetical protein